MDKLEVLRNKLNSIRESLNENGIKYDVEDSYASTVIEDYYKRGVESVYNKSFEDVVTNFDIFEELVSGVDDVEVIDEIIKNIESQTKETVTESKELQEGTSNFGYLEYVPLLVFYTCDEFYAMMHNDRDYPQEEDFEHERENGDFYIDYDAYEDAKEKFEEEYWEKNEVCVLDEDEVERLEDRLYDFNKESENMAYDADVNADGYQEYGVNLNLEDIKVQIASGYYAAQYLDVEHEDWLGDLEPDFRDQQIARFNNFFEELRKEFGLTKLGVAWAASNGETGYSIVRDDKDESLDEHWSLAIVKNNGKKEQTPIFDSKEELDKYLADHSELEVIKVVSADDNLEEDTVKNGNKWVNKGKEGTHGEFKTKKEADAQRKAMFSTGYHEDIDEKLVQTKKDLDDEIYIEYDVSEKKYYIASDYDRYQRPFDSIEKAEQYYNWNKKDVRSSILECLDEEIETSREEYCVLVDGNNADCFETEEEAIKYARHKAFDDKTAKVKVQLVKYGPKDEHGDEPELSSETIWATSFEEDLDEDADDYDLPKEVIIDMDDLDIEDYEDEDEVSEVVGDYLSNEYGFCHYGFNWEFGDDVGTIKVYDIEWDTSESLKESKKPLDKKSKELKGLYDKYVKEWKEDHKGSEYKGMEPASFDEWYDNEYLDSFDESLKENAVTNDKSLDAIKDEVNPMDVISKEEQEALAKGEVTYDETGNVEESLEEKKHTGRCPYCDSENIDFVDSDGDSEKHVCHDCGQDFLVHDDGHVTTRNNRPIEESLNEDTYNGYACKPYDNLSDEEEQIRHELEWDLGAKEDKMGITLSHAYDDMMRDYKYVRGNDNAMNKLMKAFDISKDDLLRYIDYKQDGLLVPKDHHKTRVTKESLDEKKKKKEPFVKVGTGLDLAKDTAMTNKMLDAGSPVGEELTESMESEVVSWWKEVEDANREMKWEINIDNGDYSDVEAMHAAMFDMLDVLKDKGAFGLFKKGKKIYNKYAKYSKYNEELEESCSDKELVDKLVAFGTCADEKEAKERVAKMSQEDKEKMCKSLSTQAKDHLLNDSLNEDDWSKKFKEIESKYIGKKAEFLGLDEYLDDDGELEKYEGKVIQNAKNLNDVLDLDDKLDRLLSKISVYVGLNYTLDTSSSFWSNKSDQFSDFYSGIATKLSFIETELSKLTSEKLDMFLKEEPNLNICVIS